MGHPGPRLPKSNDPDFTLPTGHDRSDEIRERLRAERAEADLAALKAKLAEAEAQRERAKENFQIMIDDIHDRLACYAAQRDAATAEASRLRAVCEAAARPWTQQVPEESGFYLWRPSLGFYGEPAQITPDGACLRMGCEWRFRPAEMGGEWSGPIHDPGGDAIENCAALRPAPGGQP